MDAQGLAEATYRALQAKQGPKPRFDEDMVAKAMHAIAKANGVSIFEWPDAVERLQEMMRPARPGPASYLPLIFALDDLRIRFHPDEIATPAEFSRSASLVRGDTPLPEADDATVESRLRAAGIVPSPETDAADMALRFSCPGWPEDALVALRGIVSSGAGAKAMALSCALHALTLNRHCTLARQLMRMVDGSDASSPVSG